MSRRRTVAGALALAGVAVGGGALALATLLPGAAAEPPAARPTVVASVPYWNLGPGVATVLAHRHDVTEVSPWMYGLTSAGAIDRQYPPDQAAAVSRELARLRAAGLPLVPTLANITGGRWAYQPAAAILHDPARMRAQVQAIAALARQQGYAGIDLDFEQLRAGDRQAFSAFVTALAATLHAEGRTLSVAVYAKTSAAGGGGPSAAQDYAAIGRAADQVRVMAYDFHWADSAPGPVAPVPWVRDVLRYARTQVPAPKIILGIPLYGYDWAGHHAAGLSWQAAAALSRSHGASLHYDQASQAPWFTYRAGGREHVVWFEDRASTRAKLALAREAGAGGVFLWMYGQEDSGTWPALRHTIGPPAPAAAGRRAP